MIKNLPFEISGILRLFNPKALFVFLLLIINNLGFAQTLISPTGDGGFETGTTFSSNGWTQVGTVNPTWYVGNGAIPYAGSGEVHIGTGASNFSSSSPSGVKHFYRDVTIPTGATNISLSFYMKMPVVDFSASASYSFDYFKVFTTSTSNIPVNNTVPGTGYTQIFGYEQPSLTGWTNKAVSLSNSLAGTTIRLVFTFRNDGISPNAYVALDNISLTYTPSTPYVAAGTLSDFGNVCINSTSTANSFTLSGGNLTPSSSVTVGALAGFSYSLSPASTYSSTLSVPTDASGNISSTSVYVKFSPTAVQSYNGNLPISGAGLSSTVNVATTGSGVNTVPSISANGTSGNITSTGATISGSTISAIGCSSISAYGIEYSTTNGFVNGTGTKVQGTGFSGVSGGSFSTALTGLLSGTTYYYKAYATSSGGTTYYSTQGSFTTACAAISTFPFSQGFNSSILPSCFVATEGAAGASHHWEPVTSDASHGSGSSKEGSHFLRMNYYNASTSYNTYDLTTIPFQLPSLSKRARFSIWMGANSGVNNLEFQISVNGSSYTTIATYTANAANSSSTSPWDEKIIDLSSYANNLVVFRLKATSNFGSNFCNIGFDDFNIEDMPSCLSPTSLSSSNITSSSANISWTAPSIAPANGYEYYYSTTNTTPALSQIASGSTAAGTVSASLSTLNPATRYYFWVRSVCSSADKSAWSAVGNFTTACTVPSAPSNVLTSNVTSTTLTVSFTAASPAPSSYMVFMSTATTAAPALSAGVTYTAGSDYTINGQVYRCVISNGSAVSYNLTGGVANTKYNYFVFSSSNANSCYGAPWYSSASLGSAVTCAAAPTGLTASNASASGATFSWTSPVGGNAGTITSAINIYSDSGYTNLVTSVNNVTSPYTLSSASLNPGTTYYYRVVNTNAGGCATSADGGSFTTACIVSSLPVSEGFNSLSKPNCWTVQYPSTTRISFLTAGTNPTTLPSEEIGMVRYNSYNTSDDERLMSLPISSLGASSLDLEFMWRNDNTAYTAATYDNEGVQIQYSLDGTTWTNVSNGFFKRVDTTLPAGGAKWNKKVITLPAAVANKNIFYIGFNFLSEFGDNMFIDGVRIQPTPMVITISSSETLPLCNGNSTTLNASSSADYTYTWSPNAGLNSTTGANVMATPEETTTYTVTGVLPSGIQTSKTITVNVNPSTTPVVIASEESPIGATGCSLDYVKLDVTGGDATTVLLSEKFDANTIPAGWNANNAGNGGGTTANANWTIRNDGYTYLDSGNGINIFYNSDGNNFIMSNSDAQGGSTTINNTTRLITPAFSSVGMDHLDLTFYANYEYDTGDHFYIDISTDGGTNYINGIADTTNPTRLGLLSIGSSDGTYTTYTETLTKYILNLDAYINQPNIKIRFRYVHSYDYWLALDNVEVLGTKKTISWATTNGLYTDSALTLPYTSGLATTLYAAPSGTQNYVVTSTAPSGCSKSDSKSVTRDKYEFRGTNNSDWATASNWFPAIVPDANKCANIPASKTVEINSSATAKSITLDATGKLTIKANQSLTVADALTINNNAAKDNFVIETGANLLQQSTAANNPVGGQIQVQRAVSNIKNNAATTGMSYLFWSSPVYGQATKGTTGFSPGTPNNRFFEYYEPTDTFKETNDATFVAGKGYAVRAETSGVDSPTYGKTYTFTGVPNNGDISIVLKRTKDSGINTGAGIGYNLVGNPYPSGIDLRKLFAANTNVIENLAYFWTNNVYTATQLGAGYSNYSSNNYAVFNGTGGNPATSAPGGDNTTPDGYVAVGQGFIVQAKNKNASATSTPDNTLVFKNSYSPGNDLRVAAPSHFFSKQDETPQNRFWIKLISPSNLANTQLIGYLPGATNGFDEKFDAEDISGSSDLFYSVLGSKQLLIQGRSEIFDSNDVVPVGANFYQAGVYRIAIDRGEGIFGSAQRIFLRDKLLNQYHDLTQGEYSFTASKGNNDSRFEIVYKEVTLQSNETVKSYFNVYRDGNSFTVSSSKKLGKVMLYDAAGKLIKMLHTKDSSIKIDMSAVPDGFYIIKADNSGDPRTKKIINTK